MTTVLMLLYTLDVISLLNYHHHIYFRQQQYQSYKIVIQSEGCQRSLCSLTGHPNKNKMKVPQYIIQYESTKKTTKTRGTFGYKTSLFATIPRGYLGSFNQ